MTNQQIIDAATGNPSVREAYTTHDATGAAIPSSPAVLAAAAGTMLQFVLGELLMDQSIRRRILERSMSIAPSSTTFTCDASVSRILGILTGEGGRPLRFFDNKGDHDLWLYQNYDTESISSSDLPIAVYESGRGANGEIQITFSPGIGTETSFTMRYVRAVASPIQASVFPSDVHPILVLGVINAMTTGQYEQRYQTMRQDLALSLEVLAGGQSKMRHDPKVRKALRRLTGMVSGGSSSDASSSQKWAD